MISLKLIWASARSATSGTLHKTLGASRTLNHHCPVQAKAVVESREVQTCIVLMSRHATGIQWHITTVMCCIHAAMLLQHGWMTFWGWNEDKMSRINSLVLQGRGKCSYLAVQTAFWAQNLCQREKKKEKENQTTQSTVSWTALHSTFDAGTRDVWVQTQSGKITLWENVCALPFKCEMFTIPQTGHPVSAQSHKYFSWFLTSDIQV